MKTKILFFVAILAIVIFSSCKKENDDSITPLTPVMKITPSASMPQSQIVTAGVGYAEVLKFIIKATGTSIKISSVPILFSSSNWSVTGFIKEVKLRINGEDLDASFSPTSFGSESIIVMNNFNSDISIEDGEIVEIIVLVHTKRIAQIEGEEEPFPDDVIIRASISNSLFNDMTIIDTVTGKVFTGERQGYAPGNNIIFE